MSFVPTWSTRVLVVVGTRSRIPCTSVIRAPGWEMKAGVPSQDGLKCSWTYFICESPMTTTDVSFSGNFQTIGLDVVVAGAIVVWIDVARKEAHLLRSKNGSKKARLMC